ncbi:MAG: hypothetical protein ACRCTY_10945 [Candidatus Adiutrix sp.]
MGKQKNTHKNDALSKILTYVLGHRPDEFGLFLDEDGFVPLKELIKALNGEDPWRGLREGGLTPLINLPGDESLFEVLENKIRLKKHLAALPPVAPSLREIPKILYLPLKPPAWQVISQRGLFPKTGEAVVKLWGDKELALKIGHRLGPEAVLISILTAPALKASAQFRPYSELLWLTEKVEARFLNGPSVPPKEEAPLPTKAEIAGKSPSPQHLKEAEPQIHRGKKKGKHSDAPDWKNQVRLDRRQK